MESESTEASTTGEVNRGSGVSTVNASTVDASDVGVSAARDSTLEVSTTGGSI